MESENTTSEKSLADKHAERMKRLRELHTKRVSRKYTNYNITYIFYLILFIIYFHNFWKKYLLQNIDFI